MLQQASIRGSLGFAWRGEAAVWLPASLFTAHSFHSLLVKLLVGELVAAHGLASSPSLVDDILAQSAEKRFERLRSDVEDGGFFSAVGLKGFVEEAIFSWYLDAAAADATAMGDLSGALAAVLAQLHLYRLDTVRRVGRSRDVLRDFYEDIVPGELRKSLGEFYTPDWLAEYTVDQLGIQEQDWPGKRVLDPTCGSGTFLLEAMRRKRAAAEASGLDASDTLDMLMSSVWGFDLNPLAVQTARANVLMAVADLLKECRGKEVEIPVLLADAIYSPAAPPDDLFKVVTYTIGSDVANLKVVLPAELAVDRAALDAVFEIMGEKVELGTAYPAVEADLVASGIVSRGNARAWRPQLRQTYERVLDLHKRDWNGIWFRIVRNFFWSATAGKFDAVMGNPPWVRWSNLPVAYRNRAKPTCERYDIFSDTPYFGGNELDISAMITFTTADKWLDDGGRLAFVITQTVFQSPSSQGFRRFRLDGKHALVPLAVDDMKALRPFPDAANKTAVALFEKRGNARPHYPVPYREWIGMTPDAAGHVRRTRRRQGSASTGASLQRVISPTLSKADVLQRMTIKELQATPASPDQPGAPWAVMDATGYEAHGELLGRSDWVHGRKGITTDLNGVFFVTIGEVNEKLGIVEVTTRPQEGRRDIGGERSFWVEPDMLYPLPKGAGDFEANRLRPEEELYAFVPNRGINRGALREARETLAGMARTKRFFAQYKEQLENRSTYRGRLQAQQAHFASIFNVGDYTFAPYKVVWPEMASTFKAAVATRAPVPILGRRPYVPDHKVYFVDFYTPRPAYYLCGLLNCSPVRAAIESHTISIQIGNVFKHVSLPHYDDGDPLHHELAREVRDAHRASARTERMAANARADAIAERIVARFVDGRRQAGQQA